MSISSRFPVLIRPLLLAGLGLVVIAAQASPAAASKTPLRRYFPAPVYVALQREGAVEVLPGKTICPGFPQAHYLGLGPRGRWLVISGFATGNVYLADTASGGKVATLRLGGRIQGVKIDPLGRFALAVDAPGGSVKVIGLEPPRIVKSIPVGPVPHNVIFSPDGRYAYVTLQGADKLAVIDMQRLKVVRRIPLPGMDGPHNLDLNAAGTRLWIRSRATPRRDGSVAVLDLRTGKILRSFRVGRFHGGIDIVPGGRYVFATNIGSDTVDVFDPHALRRVKRIRVGRGPHGVRASPRGRWVYVSAARGTELDVIDTRTLEVVKRIHLPRGSFPFWLAVVGNP